MRSAIQWDNIYPFGARTDRASGGTMFTDIARKLRLPLGAALLLHLTACGTILYPERKGQKKGQIDIAVAILDGIGLLFFIIPGVIAFAVDFNNGAIYLPKSGKGLLNLNEMEKLKFNPGRHAQGDVERILSERLGAAIWLNDRAIEVYALESPDEIPERFASAAGRNAYAASGRPQR